MQLSLRSYVTAGVAVAGASVIAIASIQPTPPDVRIPKPVAEVARDVQLTANGTLPSIETQYNDLVLGVTELGLSLTVPPTAAVINAIAPDLIPEESTAEAVATGLLLGLSGYAISGVGSIGTALQRVIVGFGCPSTGGLCEDLGTGYLALLVGAPSTIIDGFVNGGYGPDLEPLLFGTDTSRVIFAGGLINPGTTEPPFILPGTFPTVQGLAERLVVSDLNNLGGLLGDLLDNLPGLGLLGSSGPTTTTSVETMSINNVDTSNENLVKVDLPTQGEEARGKHAAPETTLPAPLKSFPGQAADSAPKLAGAFEGATPAPEFGEAVKVAANPNRVPGGTTVVRDSLSFVPETGKKNGGNSGDSNPASTEISSTVTGFGDAVSNTAKSATGLGAGSKKNGGEE
jgi:hypothetical protein